MAIYDKDQTETQIDLLMNVDAYIARDPAGTCRVFVKRDKYKHWFELGQHAETDAAFERALAAGTVRWKPEIVDRSKLF